MSNEFIVKFRPFEFRQSRNKLNMLNLFRLCRKDEISFDIVAETGNIVAKNGNNVEATFDFVEWIVRLVAFDYVASTVLLRHCCWYGTGLNLLCDSRFVILHSWSHSQFLPCLSGRDTDKARQRPRKNMTIRGWAKCVLLNELALSRSLLRGGLATRVVANNIVHICWQLGPGSQTHV